MVIYGILFGGTHLVMCIAHIHVKLNGDKEIEEISDCIPLNRRTELNHC